MRVLILSTYDTLGGAAKAAYRLHRALLSIGVESRMLVQEKIGDDPTVIHAYERARNTLSLNRPTLDRAPLEGYRIIQKVKPRRPFSMAWVPSTALITRINELKPDIAHLQWVCDGFISIEEIPEIESPIVWSLHDMWPFTGGCHYDENCGRYEYKCGRCKILESQSEFDLSRAIWYRKHKAFLKIRNLVLVGVSRWISECARKSSLFKGRKVLTIPNPIDTEVFKPSDKREARRLWNLPQDKRIVLFGAVGATSDPRKGFRELSEALSRIDRKDIELVIFGSDEPKNPPRFGFKTHYVGTIDDEVRLSTLYSSADVMVVPSLQESFGQTASEALACGTPVVAFGCTGLLDIVDHKINGYLAKPFDPSELAYGIEWILDNPNYERMRERAREKVLREFEKSIVAERYKKLYEDLLTMHTSQLKDRLPPQT